MKMHRIKHLKLHAGQGNDSMQSHIDLVLQLSHLYPGLAHELEIPLNERPYIKPSHVYAFSVFTYLYTV
jgi:hypothetical protein